jgi:probable F420-dependent oxidoreductase
MELTKFGIWTSQRALGGEQQLGPAAAVAERLGYGAIWLGGSPRLAQTRALLSATERIVVATGIVKVWQYEPAQLAAEFAQLEADFPGRLLVGLGVGHPESTGEYRTPLEKMRSFLDGLATARDPVPKERMCLAALGPRMLDLAGARTLGTHPYFTPPAHTRFARERLGAGALVAPELAVVLDSDHGRARATARDYAKVYLGLRNYTSNLLRHGFSESDLADGGSDALIDTLVPQGDAARLAEAVHEHLRAGADHVCVQTVGVAGVPEHQWAALADALGLHAAL